MIAIQLIGASSLMDKLSNLGEKALDNALKRAALKVEAAAKKATVWKFGRLRASIGIDSKENNILVGTRVKYAPFIEYGTRYMKARHMEGARKVLGEGMFAYTLKSFKWDEIQAKVINDLEKNWRS